MKRHEELDGGPGCSHTWLSRLTPHSLLRAPRGFRLSNLLLSVALHPLLMPQVAFSTESLPLVPFPQIRPASALSHTSSPVLGLEKVSLQRCCRPLPRGHFQHCPASFFPEHFSSCVIDRLYSLGPTLCPSEACFIVLHQHEHQDIKILKRLP